MSCSSSSPRLGKMPVKPIGFVAISGPGGRKAPDLFKGLKLACLVAAFIFLSAAERPLTCLKD